MTIDQVEVSDTDSQEKLKSTERTRQQRPYSVWSSNPPKICAASSSTR